ncbi:MAG: twin-arginine translocase TatA/TatE family subunit [Bacteroidales bacterium]|nr:twin-arginine translocase TatA/TatE family subunit [Bacteroidales bacterium]
MTLLFIGSTELIIIAGVALLIFGGKKIPELMKGIGKGVKSFKEGMNEPLVDDEKDKDKNDGTEEEKGTEKEKSEEKE